MTDWIDQIAYCLGGESTVIDGQLHNREHNISMKEEGVFGILQMDHRWYLGTTETDPAVVASRFLDMILEIEFKDAGAEATETAYLSEDGLLHRFVINISGAKAVRRDQTGQVSALYWWPDEPVTPPVDKPTGPGWQDLGYIDES